MEALVELEHVSVAYQDLIALEDITLCLYRGEFLAILGPNGSGKTTLVKTMLGLITPIRGTVRLFGKPPRLLGKVWGRIGYVPQLIHLDPRFPLRVFDVVLMGRYAQLGMVRRPGRHDREAAWLALKRVGLAELAKRQIGKLSGGQRQRVLLARALVSNPELLILDEPTTGVDIGTTESLFELLDQLHAEGITLVIVSHDIGIVAQHVDRIACLNRRLVAHGRPAEVLQPSTIACMYGPRASLFGHGTPHIVVPPHDTGKEQKC